MTGGLVADYKWPSDAALLVFAECKMNKLDNVFLSQK